MPRPDNAIRLKSYLPSPHQSQNLDNPASILLSGGLFLEPAAPPSILNTLTGKSRRRPGFRGGTGSGELFLSVSLSVGEKKGDEVNGNSGDCLVINGSKVGSVEGGGGGATLARRRGVGFGRQGAVNTTKHLWAGAVAAMVSRFVLFICTQLSYSFCSCRCNF